MKKSLPLIIVLGLLALVGFVLFFWNMGRLSDKEAAMQQQMDTLFEEQTKLADMEESMAAERAENDRLAKEAMAARQMAEAQADKERIQREKLVAELNARLKQEAEERRQAELAQQELEEKMAALQLAQQEAQTALAQLQASREGTAETEPGAADLQQKLLAQEQQLAALEQENQTLKERQQVLTARQAQTEEAILSAGGRVDIPYPEIRSPNVKRREAIYFKQRVAGRPQDGG